MRPVTITEEMLGEGLGWQTWEDYIDLRDFGARDGFDITDALNGAFEHMIAKGGGHLYIPQGHFYYGDIFAGEPIELDNVTIRGSGKATTLLECTSTNNRPIYLQACNRLRLTGLHFKGNNTSYVSDGNDKEGIEFRQCTHCEVVACKFEGYEIAVRTRDVNRYLLFAENELTGNFYGALYLKGGSGDIGTNHWIVNNLMRYNGDACSAIRIIYQTDSIIAGNVVQWNHTGIVIEHSERNSIINNVCVENDLNGIHLYNGAQYNTVQGNQCFSNNQSQSGAMDFEASVGNAYRHHSGIMLENEANYNVLMGNVCRNPPGGHQRYGIAANIRNFPNASTSSEKNIIMGNVCIGNTSEQIEDRGQVNLVGFNIALEKPTGIGVTPNFQWQSVLPIHRFTAVPAAGTWRQGNIVRKKDVAAAGDPGWVCITTGTFGVLNGGATTGTTVNGEPVVLPSSLTDLAGGVYIDVAGAMTTARVLHVPAALGSTTVDVQSASGQPVLSVLDTTDFEAGDTILIDRAGTPEVAVIAEVDAGISLTLTADLANTHNVGVTVENVVLTDTAAGAAVGGAAVSFTTPEFKAMANIDA